ncbi:MAG: hypothetical protein OWQ48_01550 [Desulfurococcus sp.]|nr:hypothetical protein [Desulfurococcus sp.]
MLQAVISTIREAWVRVAVFSSSLMITLLLLVSEVVAQLCLTGLKPLHTKYTYGI